MKKIVIILALFIVSIVILSGCFGLRPYVQQASECNRQMKIDNPEKPSKYFCECMGGEYTIETIDGINKGFCKVGLEVEDTWDYYCEHNPEDETYENCPERRIAQSTTSMNIKIEKTSDSERLGQFKELGKKCGEEARESEDPSIYFSECMGAGDLYKREQERISFYCKMAPTEERCEVDMDGKWDYKFYCTEEQIARHSERLMCIQVYNPVCGSDGITYPHTCGICKDKTTDFYWIQGEC